MSRELGGQLEIDTGQGSCHFIFNMVSITVCVHVCGIKPLNQEQ